MADNKKSVSKRNTLPKKTHYHAAFLSGLEILFWPYRNQIIMVPEKSLSTEGIRMDILLLKKEPSLEMDSDIARIFREHNIIEYKSFDDALTIDVFAKVMAYAHLYKSRGPAVNAIPFSNISATIYRHRYPRKVFKELKSYGAAIEKPYPGVYYVRGLAPFSVQILVGKELDPYTYSMFRVLLPNAFEEDIRRFKDIAVQNRDGAYNKSVDNIMQVSVSVNKETYARLRKEDSDMCEALRELMKDDFDKVTEEARKRAEEADKRANEADKRAVEARKRADQADKRADQADKRADEASKRADEAEQERDAAIKERDDLLRKLRALSEQNPGLNLQIEQ